MTTIEVAAKLGVTRQTVSRWIRDKKLAAITIGVGQRRPIYRVREADFIAFVRRYVRGLD